jgi:hypothetical protein
MAVNTADVAVAANGNLYIGTLAAVDPTDLYAAWPTGWKDAGLLTPDGIQFTPNNKTIEDVPAWQLLDAVRRLVTGRNVQMQATFLQYNRDTFEFASGGGTWTQLTTRQTWLATTAYTLNQIREPTIDNTLIYKVTTAGTSSGTQPTWPLTTGATVTDGTVVWTCLGLGDTEVYEFLPAEPETLDRRRIGWEWRDGAKVERVTLSRGIVTSGEAIQYRRSQANQMQVTFAIEGQSGVKPYRKIDNFSAVIA